MSLANSGFPALMIKQPESPIQQMGQVQQIQAGQQENQMRQIQLQEARQGQQEQQTIMQLYRQNQGDLGKTIVAATATGTVRPNTLLQLQNQHIAMQTALAGMQEKQLVNATSIGDKMAGALEAVKNVPEAQRPETLKNQMAALAAQGVPIDAIQKQTSSLPDLSNDTLSGLEATLIGHNKAVEQELDRRKTAASELSAKGTEARGQAALREVPSIIAKNVAETGAANVTAGQKGAVTAADIYKENQANYRATLQRQSESSNSIQRQGIESLQKQSDTYSQFSTTAQSLKNSLAAATTGNQMAAAVAPLQGTLFITTAEGVKRINETELKGVSGAGSLVQRINGALGKVEGEGPLSPKLKQDMSDLVDLYTNAKYDNYKKQAFYTQKLHGLDFAKTPILDRDGSITTVPNAGQTNAEPAKPAAQTKGPLSLAEAQSYLQKAGGDKDKARQLAKADGRSF